MNKLRQMSGSLFSPMDTVCRLLFWGRPAAIAWFVIAVVIDPVNGQAGGLRAHVGQEVLEPEPSLANDNAPAAIMAEAFVFRGGTPTVHRQPGLVGRRLSSVDDVAVRFRDAFSVPRAISDAPSFEIVGARSRFAPTVAEASPAGRAVNIDVRKAKDRQTAEALANEIEARRHDGLF